MMVLIIFFMLTKFAPESEIVVGAGVTMLNKAIRAVCTSASEMKLA
jgi:hypothetical protein